MSEWQKLSVFLLVCVKLREWEFRRSELVHFYTMNSRKLVRLPLRPNKTFKARGTSLEHNSATCWISLGKFRNLLSFLISGWFRLFTNSRQVLYQQRQIFVQHFVKIPLANLVFASGIRHFAEEQISDTSVIGNAQAVGLRWRNP